MQTCGKLPPVRWRKNVMSCRRHPIIKRHYVCILLDIMLPDGSGLDLLEELHALGKRTNVIILSAKDSLEDKVKGLDLGADDYLPKPNQLAEINERLKSQ